MTTITAASTDLFRHVTADKAALYRAIMDVFATAKRQYRTHGCVPVVLPNRCATHWGSWMVPSCPGRACDVP